MQLMYELQEMLAEISGFAEVTLQPAAGAHGELTGCLVIRAYHQDHGNIERTEMLVPDSAHGTNPGDRRPGRIRCRHDSIGRIAAMSMSRRSAAKSDRRPPD